MSALLDELLAKPIGKPAKRAAEPLDIDLTSALELAGDMLTATVRVDEGEDAEGKALEFLKEEGQSPEEWEVTGFRKIKYGNPAQPYESVRFTYRRRTAAGREPLDIDHLVDRIETSGIHYTASHGGGPGAIVAIGDMQFGKIDGDGVEGTIARAIACIDEAARRLEERSQWEPLEHILTALLGDHVEGFVSQGGANVWRTQLTMSEQIRLTRRVMLHALKAFAPLADKVTMAAVPGNHGETVRFSGKGVTRYDDSHDTESLIAVADAAAMNPDAFGHVEFLVPDTDEMVVVVDVAGTRVGMVHGHQFRPGKHFEWWEGQSFGGSALRDVDLMLAGHLHHEFIDTSGPRTWAQVPAMESESSWWRHAKGVYGAPGLLLMMTKDGLTDEKHVIRQPRMPKGGEIG